MLNLARTRRSWIAGVRHRTASGTGTFLLAETSREPQRQERKVPTIEKSHIPHKNSPPEIWTRKTPEYGRLTRRLSEERGTRMEMESGAFEITSVFWTSSFWILDSGVKFLYAPSSSLRNTRSIEIQLRGMRDRRMVDSDDLSVERAWRGELEVEEEAREERFRESGTMKRSVWRGDSGHSTKHARRVDELISFHPIPSGLHASLPLLLVQQLITSRFLAPPSSTCMSVFTNEWQSAYESGDVEIRRARSSFTRPTPSSEPTILNSTVIDASVRPSDRLSRITETLRRETQRESLPVHREEPGSVHPLSGVQGLARDLRVPERWRRVGLGDLEDDDEADDGSCIVIMLLEVEDAIDDGRWVGWRMEDIRWRVEDVRKDGPTVNEHRQRQQPEELELDTTRTLKHMNPSQPIPLVSSKYSSLSLSLSVSHSHSLSLVPRHVIRVVIDNDSLPLLRIPTSWSFVFHPPSCHGPNDVQRSACQGSDTNNDEPAVEDA
ncbi:hypothetical protein SCHPADRAFT_895904 [Schizopora paradoxa]|uniref:Uncharacterized protein n=1 Tax=Schizopora paradoxa TaxID=27342 RepID=A0A0H2R8Q3_9AGAM|nr:hypothetical protein SCHPADRAFT_895904 [Schizopora paradoxa]